MLKLNAATGRPLAGYALAVFFVTGLVYCTIYTAFHSSLPVSITFTKSPSSIGSAISSQNSAIFSPDRANRLPHVPPKIWQIWLDSLSTAPEYYKESSQSFIRHSAGHAYTVIDGPGARSFITTLSKFHEHANLLSQYHAISRRVVRVDFLRYLVLAVEGGIYSDADTMMLRPVDEWVPAKYKRKAKLIVGIEADSDVPTAVTGAAFQVQFAMWTIASSANHPVLWAMIDRILSDLASRPSGSTISDNDVLKISGPMAWSAVVYAALSDAEGTEINHTHVQNLQEPVLFGDILVLPLWAFAADFGNPASANRALVRHSQTSSWRGESDVIS